MEEDINPKIFAFRTPPLLFSVAKEGTLKFDIRKNVGFKLGDWVNYIEWYPNKVEPTGKSVLRKIDYISHNGVEDGYIAFSFK